MEVSNPRRILAVSLDSQADPLSKVIKGTLTTPVEPSICHDVSQPITMLSSTSLTSTTDLTGSSPTSPSTSLAGSTHNLPLKTQYYTATVPIWLDLIASPSEWSSSFLSDEAGEVLAVLGGLVLIFALPSTSTSEHPTTSIDQIRDVIHHVGEVVNKGLGGWEWDGVRLAIGVGDSDADEWDELCAEAGLEFVQVGGTQVALNEFGGTFSYSYFSHFDQQLHHPGI